MCGSEIKSGQGVKNKIGLVKLFILIFFDEFLNCELTIN